MSIKIPNYRVFFQLRLIPRGVWALGLVSLFMDTSSELVHSLLPVFMVTTLGASKAAVGLIEGIAEATALVVRMFSGVLSDYLRRRKFLTLLGYGLSALTKPLFPLANSLGLIGAARFFDRIGKGIRGAPRDALLGEIAPESLRGASFGLGQALDTVGAFLGPLLAMGGLLLFSGDIRAVLWIAVLPALISVLILVWGVQEPESSVQAEKVRNRFKVREVRRLGSTYWGIVLVGGFLALARFGGAFLILKASVSGVPMTFIPLVMVGLNVVYAAAVYPAGVLSDLVSRKIVVLIGALMLVGANLVLSGAGGVGALTCGLVLWGLHLAFSEGVLAAMITDVSSSDLRGTAFGVFSLISGMATLVSSVGAGLLWDAFGVSAMFLVGAACAVLAFIGAVVFLYPTWLQKSADV
ncbi:TPA: MFS transporter [Candidatus Dependentiae bacterium]|nr:MAG: Major facilitator superfamily [candidate division TM6 bacterium GW2011_GWF2_43_87]HBL98105.1 MFS transporter [Candidatus Dependentiae bacterium]